MTAVAIERSSVGRRLEVPDFAEFGGRHCETASFRKLLSHAGVQLSEELLFGLGGGVGFVYWDSKSMPVPFVGGRNGKFPDFLDRSAAALGLSLEVLQTGSRRIAYGRLAEELEAGRPALCYGDIFHLPYFHATRHFGGHAFVIYGLQEDSGRVLISDRGTSPRHVTTGELAEARDARGVPFPPRNTQLRLRGEAVLPIGEAELRVAIGSSCDAMLRPPIRNLGLAGLRKWSAHLAELVENAPAERLVDELTAAYVDLELAGTGGSAFRAMYRDFLSEAAASVPDPTLLAGVALADDAVAAWRELIDAMLPAAVPALERVRQLLARRSETFEVGTAETVAAAGALAEPLDEARALAIDALARSRKPLRALPELVLAVHGAEARLAETLAEVAPA